MQTSSSKQYNQNPTRSISGTTTGLVQASDIRTVLKPRSRSSQVCAQACDVEHCKERTYGDDSMGVGDRFAPSCENCCSPDTTASMCRFASACLAVIWGSGKSPVIQYTWSFLLIGWFLEIRFNTISTVRSGITNPNCLRM